MEGGHARHYSAYYFFRFQLRLGTKREISTLKFGYSIEQLLDYLRMQNLSYMERDNDRVFSFR